MIQAIVLTGLLLGNSSAVQPQSSRTVQHPCGLLRVGMTRTEVAMNMKETPVCFGTFGKVACDIEFYFENRVTVCYARDGTVESINQISYPR